MKRLKERPNPNDRLNALEGPTKRKTRKNQYALHCEMCGETYYVDEDVYRRISSAVREDPAGIPFYCDDCWQTWGEEDRSH